MPRADRDTLPPCRRAHVLPPLFVETRGLPTRHPLLNPAHAGTAIRLLENAEGG